MAVAFLSGNKITATSGDVKPTLVATNSTLLETDTNITFQWNGSAWVQLDVGVGDTVSESEITGTISDSKLASGISGSKITDGTISIGKIASGTAGKIVGFNASTGAIEEQDAPSAGGGIMMTHDTTVGNYSNATTVTSSTGGASQSESTIIKKLGGYGDYNNWTASVGFNSSIELARHNFSTPVNVTNTWTSGGGNNGGFYHQISTDNGSTWTNVHSGYLTGSGVGGAYSFVEQNPNNITGVTNMRMLVSRGSSGSQPYGWFSEFRVYYTSFQNPADLQSGNAWASATAVNPQVVFDMGSSTLTSGVTIYHDSTTTTETQYLIQTSDDNSTWTTKRTVNVSSLVNDSDNFIRFAPHNCRYIRLYGNSGSSSALSLDHFKVKKGISDSTLLANHEHLDIDTTNASLGLDGT